MQSSVVDFEYEVEEQGFQSVSDNPCLFVMSCHVDPAAGIMSAPREISLADRTALAREHVAASALHVHCAPAARQSRLAASATLAEFARIFSGH
jgi:hypothetical protein